MPLYEYKCECGMMFEELAKSSEDGQTKPCPKCGKDGQRQISTFSHSVVGGSSNETIDQTIGREANKRWQSYHDRQSKRHGDRTLQPVEQPRAKDGSFMPVMALGGNQERTKRSEYVDALQEHRRKRVEKGLAQFSGRGEF